MPATTEYFNKQKTGKLGLRADCKNCKKEKNKEWREANKGITNNIVKKIKNESKNKSETVINDGIKKQKTKRRLKVIIHNGVKKIKK